LRFKEEEREGRRSRNGAEEQRRSKEGL